MRPQKRNAEINFLTKGKRPKGFLLKILIPLAIFLFISVNQIHLANPRTFSEASNSSSGSMTLSWNISLGGAFSYTSPVISKSENQLYLASSTGNVYAVSLNGTLKWKFPTDPISASIPAIGDDGAIYVGSSDSLLHAINPNGSEKWNRQLGFGIPSSPAIDNPRNRVYVGNDAGVLYAFDTNGSLIWKFQTGSAVSSSPAIGSDGTVYIGSSNFNFYALSPNGTLIWKLFTGIPFASYAPVVFPNSRTVYALGEDGHLYAIDSNGTLKWKSPVSYEGTTSPTLAPDGTLYLIGIFGTLYAINPTHGDPIWQRTISGGGYYPFSSKPVITNDGNLFVGNSSGFLLEVNSSDGTLESETALASSPITSPVVGPSGTIYAPSSNGNLYAVENGITSTTTTGNSIGISTEILGIIAVVIIVGITLFVFILRKRSLSSSVRIQGSLETFLYLKRSDNSSPG